MVESLCRDHGALQPVRGQRLLDTGHNVVLFRGSQSVSRDHVRVVCGPVADANSAVLLDDSLEADWLSRWCMEQRVALVGGSPLWTGDEVFASSFGRV